MTDTLLTTNDAAARICLSARTLEKWRITGEGPNYIKAGKRVLYRQSDLLAWLESRRRRSTSDDATTAI